MSSRVTIDAESGTTLRRVAEDIRAKRESIVLRLDGEDIAVISPVMTAKTEMVGVLTRAEYDSLMSAAGGWAGIVDTEQLKADLQEERGQGIRPWDRRLT